MTDKRPLTLRGFDVAIEGRRPDGRALVDVLDGRGRRSERYTQAWPHELRGIGWGLSDIKAAIAAAPLVSLASDKAPAALSSDAPKDRRRMLFAHHVAARQED